MREICIPVPAFGNDQIAEVTLTIDNKKVSYSYRVESFPWRIESEIDDEDEHNHATLEQIEMLRKSLASYSREWELIQIYTPAKSATHIQVLFRKRNIA